MVKPLAIVLNWNRLDALRWTLESLRATTEPDQLTLVVVDNGSKDGSAEWLQKIVEGDEEGFIEAVELLPENVGCPRGFNHALSLYRQPGQPVAKIDGDVTIVTKGWVPLMMQWEQVRDVGIVTAWWWGAHDHRVMGTYRDEGTGLRLQVTDFVPGHFMWITGHALDRLGYFDVLAPDHFYGYDDVLMVMRCRKLRMLMGMDKRLDAHSTEYPEGTEPILPDGKRQREHAAHIQERYLERLHGYQSGELDCYVGEDGGLG